MSTAHAHVWRAAQERLRRQLKRAEYDTWLRDTHLSTERDGSAVLRVRTTFACELVKSRYRDLIEAALSEVTGQPYTLKVAVMAAGEADISEDEVVAATEQTRERRATSSRLMSRQVQRGYDGPSLFGGEEETPVGMPAPIASDDDSTDTEIRPRLDGEGRPREGRIPQRHVDARGGGGDRNRNTHMEERIQRPSQTSQVSHVPRSGGGRLSADGAARGESDDGFTATSLPDNPGHRQTPRIPQNGTVPMETHGNPRQSRGDANGSSGRGQGDGSAPRYADENWSQEANSSNISIPAPRLNPRYTFSTFIVGSGNQLAHAASLAVADAPGEEYNPLFLYGGVGLGKTHLLHAVGHTALERNQTVLYVSSETFTNEIINAIRYRTTEDFRAKYRSADVLLVDDIQFIAGKESTEEEFFHTFNSLYETNKQIVICSDRPPKAMVALAERLRSRFEWGLIADIQPPDLETRVAILRAKADMMGRVVPDDVVSFLASRVHSNIRELEGGFNRLLAFSQLQGLPLTIDTAKAALASLAADGRQRRVGVDDVLQAVAEHFRIPVEDLRGKQRDKHIVVPRQIAMYLMRQETEASLLEIGQSLGGRDHSTVLHGCDKINREVNENASLRKDVLAIRQQLIG